MSTRGAACWNLLILKVSRSSAYGRIDLVWLWSWPRLAAVDSAAAAFVTRCAVATLHISASRKQALTSAPKCARTPVEGLLVGRAAVPLVALDPVLHHAHGHTQRARHAIEHIRAQLTPEKVPCMTADIDGWPFLHQQQRVSSATVAIALASHGGQRQ